MSQPVKRLLIGAAALLLGGAGCSDAIQPALRAGDVELSRSELIDAVQQLGVPVLDDASIIERTLGTGTAEQPSFDTAVSLLTIDLQIDGRLAGAGLDVDEQIYEQFNTENNLPLGFDPADLPAISQLDYHLTVKVTALSVATGIATRDLIDEMYGDSEIDPRYGVMTTEGLSPPGSAAGP